MKPPCVQSSLPEWAAEQVPLCAVLVVSVVMFVKLDLSDLETRQRRRGS